MSAASMTVPLAPKQRNRRATGPERVWSALMAMAAAAPLVVGAFLSPDPAGHGTHTQLGLPPCGWVVAYGKPCPTCGMTTAFTHAAHGRIDLAAVAQPAGAVLAVLTAAVFWVGLHTAGTGSRVAPRMVAGIRAKHAIGLVVLILAGWGYLMLTFRPV